MEIKYKRFEEEKVTHFLVEISDGDVEFVRRRATPTELTFLEELGRLGNTSYSRILAGLEIFTQVYEREKNKLL